MSKTNDLIKPPELMEDRNELKAGTGDSFSIKP